MPIYRGAQCAEPAHIRQVTFKSRLARQKQLAADGWLRATELDQRGRKANEVVVLTSHVPVKPSCLVVLTIGVVVALLRAPAFIAGEQHWHTLADHQRGQKVLDLPDAEIIDLLALGWTLDAVVIAVVVIVAVAVPFAVGLIVFLLVADEIVQRETIVRRDEVDAAVGRSARMLV